jgi:hypothetical protein
MRRTVAMVSLCAGMLVAGGCAARSISPQLPRARPSNAECDELPVVEARLQRLGRERTRIRDTLTTAGFERTAAAAFADGTAAPDLALEAARSAGGLETLLAGRTPAYAKLNDEIDWIAANWFDPALRRWTARHIRALASMTEAQFRDLKSATMTLPQIVPEIAASTRRIEELTPCGRRRFASRVTASEIACHSSSSSVNCLQTVTVEAVDPEASLRPLDAAAISAEDMRALGPDSDAWLSFARRLAGVNAGEERVFIDGMPPGRPVPASSISRIVVNGDPFSSEFSGVNEVRMDVELKPPDRRWGFGGTLPSLGAGGGSLLGRTGRPTSRTTSFGMSGPVPRSPLTFSLHASRREDARQPLFASPESGTLAVIDGEFRNTSTNSSVIAAAVYSTPRLVARATFADSRMQSKHSGVGGFHGPTTGQHLTTAGRSLQSSWRIADATRIQRGGFLLRTDRLHATADSTAPFTVITAQFRSGGDETAASERRSTGWTVKHVVDAAAGRRPWRIGGQVDREAVGDERAMNPLGRLQFPAAGAPTATWIVTSGLQAAEVTTAAVALFGEQLAVNTRRATLRGGLRLDWQHSDGLVVSPRIAAAARIADFQVSGGAGLFVQTWGPDVFVAAAQTGGTRSTTRVLQNVAPDALDAIDPAAGERLRTVMDGAFERRRDLVLRGGVQRRVGILQTGIEHTWTRGESLPGAMRYRDAGLVDRIDSDRRLRRHQTHARASLRRGVHSLVAHYTYARSVDNSDGPFGAPAAPGDVEGEWGPSSGVPRHSEGVTAMLRLPHAIRLSVALDGRSGLPYNIVTGRDAGGLATFTDRGGLARNAGVLPPARNLSMYASRTVRLRPIKRLAFDVGVRADNITNRRNITSVGRAIGSPVFGLPLTASPGRSIRFWAALAR